MKISLAMIVKDTADEAAYLDSCLASAAEHVDEIVIAKTFTDKPVKKSAVAAIAAKYGARVFDFEWIEDFSAARNFAVSKVTGEFYIWLDSDDVLEHGEKLREICANTPPHIDIIFANYDYEVDEEGHVRTKHWRDRILRNNDSTIWKGRLHETPVELRRTGKARTEEINVVHASKPDRWLESEQRNLRILTKQLEDEGSDPDPRTIFYLASCYKSLGSLGPAKELYESYLKLSGWDEERAAALGQLAEIYLSEGKEADAKAAYFKAMDEQPKSPAAYISIGELEAKNMKFERAIHWLELALKLPEYETSMVVNPLNFTYKPWMLYAECLFNTGKFSDAVAAVKKAMTYRKDDFTDSQLSTYKAALGHKLAAEAFTGLVQYLEKSGEKEKVETMLKAVPADLQDNPMVLRVKKQYTEPKVWPKKSIVIFTGASVLGEWGPWSLKEGIGGSEEAIVRLSKRLLEQGYSVTVYATPGPLAGTYEGVEWRNYWELDTRDSFDVFIAWRSPWFFDVSVKARKRYLWLHDVMEPAEFTPERLANLDKVIVLSKYHRGLFPNIPDDKIFLSANGVDADEFDGLDIKRDPHLVVYQSSHVRGLAHIYDVWPAVLKAVPDARLRIMYGWESFIAVHRDNPERMEWMEKMQQRAKALKGVEDIGKVGQEQIVTELLSTGIWAYPCPFPEISCITAMKAQIAGAIPVASNYAALAETIQHGIKLPMEEWNEETKRKYTYELIRMLDIKEQNAIRPHMMAEARKAFSWTQVAKDWISEFEA